MQSLVPPKVRKVQAIAALVAGAVVSTFLVSGQLSRHAPMQQPTLRISDRMVLPTKAEYTVSPDAFVHFVVHSGRFPDASKRDLIERWIKAALNGRQDSASLEKARKLMAPSEWARFQNIFNVAETKLYFVPTEWHWGRASVSVCGNLVGMTLEEPFINNMYLTFYLSGTQGNYRIERFSTTESLLGKFLAGRTQLKLTSEAVKEHFAAQETLSRLTRGVESDIGVGELEQTERAIEHYTRAIQASPDFFFAYFCRGFERAHLGDHDGAIADYSTAIKLNPRFFSAYLNRSYELNEIKHDFKSAIADCDMAIPSEPGQIMPYTNKAYAYCELRDYLNAIATCDDAIKATPSYARPYLAPIYNLRGYAEAQMQLSLQRQ